LRPTGAVDVEKEGHPQFNPKIFVEIEAEREKQFIILDKIVVETSIESTVNNCTLSIMQEFAL
jgi:hypothetical protein